MRLRANRKTREGAQHPDRDAQFRCLADQVNAHMDAGDPVISVDTKKKSYPSSPTTDGNTSPRDSPKRSMSTTSPHLAEGKAIPYGVYDIAQNSGWVNVGVDHDTASFAVATIGRWWQQEGRHR
ncbi:MAG: ISAzo13-like element transposase-related protein, partial [Pseudonocardiaceae bacterium]